MWYLSAADTVTAGWKIEPTCTTAVSIAGIAVLEFELYNETLTLRQRMYVIANAYREGRNVTIDVLK
jgi:hypothetical protein